MRTIGLIGGMSWESTVTYYRLINRLVQERLGGFHSARCILYSVDFHDVEASQSAGDWERGGELLAEDCDADVLFLLTAVEHVAINFGKPNQEELEDLTADEAERLADEGQFGKGSMEPKVRAAIKFARSRKGRTCIIGALDKAAETMAGLSGTRIHE